MLEKEIVKLSSWQKELIEKEQLMNMQLNEIEKMRLTYEKIQEKLQAPKEDKEVQSDIKYDEDKSQDKLNTAKDEIKYTNENTLFEIKQKDILIKDNQKQLEDKENEIIYLKKELEKQKKSIENNNNSPKSKISENNEVNIDEMHIIIKAKEEALKVEIDLLNICMTYLIGKKPLQFLDHLLILNNELVYSNFEETEIINGKIRKLKEELDLSSLEEAISSKIQNTQIKRGKNFEIIYLYSEIDILPIPINSISILNRK